MNFIGKHKVLTSVFIVIVALVILVTGTASYFFGKINITDRNTSLEPATVAVGEEISDLSDSEKKAFEDADSKIKDNLDNSKTWRSNDVMNIALLGIDYGDEKYPYGRSDAMIILSINKAVKKINVISLSRTVYSAIPGYQNTRMNHAHGYAGAPLALKTIELNYKFAIDNYISCGFDSFMKIIDILGGVDIDLSQAEVDALKKRRPDLFEKAGRYTLDGDAALRYARLRYIDSDQNRTGRQRKVVMSIMKKMKNISFSQATEIIDKVLPLVSTDFKKSEIMYQIVSAIKYLKWDTHQYFMPSKTYKLVMRDWFEVTLIDWPYEVKYLHDIMFEGVTPEYKELEK